MTKLNQIIAVEKGVKSRTYAELTEAHHALQKPELLSGIERTYQPKDEEGDQLPPESQRVQMNVPSILDRTAEILTRLFDVTATKEWANCRAVADVVVGGTVLLTAVPVTYLLFLEKQLTDVQTFVKKLPALPLDQRWEYDAAADAWATSPVQTVKTKKVMRNHVKAEATEKHPAQVEVYTEDVIVGYWKTIKYSGALPAARIKVLSDRVEALLSAVKMAREEANAIEVEDQKVGAKVFAYLFAP